MHKSPSTEAMTRSPHKTMHKSPSKETIMSSPHKNAPHLKPSTTSAPGVAQGSPRRLRKLQSAHQLSSNYTAFNAPSLISQQRQQQQLTTNISQNLSIPPVPALPSPQNHSRPRANSDVPSPHTGQLPTRSAVAKKKEDPKNELKALLRRSPKGDVLGAMDDLRHLILVDGLEADSDGMVRIISHLTFMSDVLLTHYAVRPSHLHLVYTSRRSAPGNRHISRSHTPRPFASLC